MNKDRFTFIAGPCVIESKDMLLKEAEDLKRIIDKLDIDFYFKASFDKANRTSIDSFRGPGLEKGLEYLSLIKKIYGFKLVTDIHEPKQAQEVAKICDMIQIPAFLCRQTDLLKAAAKTGKVINVKKAQFLGPWDMKNVVTKIERCGNQQILLCERGTMFGYNRLIVDMTSILEMKKIGYPVVFDATHSVQIPGGNKTTTGGNREYVEYLAKAAVVQGVNILFMEVHPDPEQALSDGPNMVKLSNLEEMLKRILEIYNVVKQQEKDR